MREADDRSGPWLLAGITLFWGLNFVAVKYSVEEVPIWTFRTICLLVGGIGLLGIAKARGPQPPRAARGMAAAGDRGDRQHHRLAHLLRLGTALRAGEPRHHPRLYDAALRHRHLGALAETEDDGTDRDGADLRHRRAGDSAGADLA